MSFIAITISPTLTFILVQDRHLYQKDLQEAIVSD
jgi:hypothetical protein